MPNRALFMLLAASLTATLAAGPATAQDATAPTPASPAAERQAQRADAVAWRAEDLIGRDIMTPGGDALATIEDLALEPNAGTVHAVVNVGGLLNIGDKEVAIALHEMTLTPDGTLVLDSTAEQLADRQHYRFDDSPQTGAVRPGSVTPQAAAGIGSPQQAQQDIPGVTGQSEPREERADLEGDEIRDNPLAQLLRGEVAEVSYDNREQYLQDAGQRLQTLNERLGARQHDDETLMSLEQRYIQATDRFAALAAASEEAWPTALKNFRVSLAQLHENWQQAEGTRKAAPANPQPAD